MQQLWEKDFREVFWSDKNFGLSGDQISWRNPAIIVEFLTMVDLAAAA